MAPPLFHLAPSGCASVLTLRIPGACSLMLAIAPELAMAEPRAQSDEMDIVSIGRNGHCQHRLGLR
jgi:hypothetical protein